MRRRAHDDEHGQLINDVGHAISRRALGWAKRPAFVDDGVPMPLVPGFQGGEPFYILGAPFLLGHRIPGRPARTPLVAQEDREIGSLRAHACHSVWGEHSAVAKAGSQIMQTNEPVESRSVRLGNFPLGLATVSPGWKDRSPGWEDWRSMLSEANAIRARPVHGKGTSHLNRNFTTG